MNNQSDKFQTNLGYLNLTFEQFYSDEYLKRRNKATDEKSQQITKRSRVNQETDTFSKKRPRINENTVSGSIGDNLPNDLFNQNAKLTEGPFKIKEEFNENSMDISNKTEFTNQQSNDELRKGEQLNELPNAGKEINQFTNKQLDDQIVNFIMTNYRIGDHDDIIDKKAILNHYTTTYSNDHRNRHTLLTRIGSAVAKIFNGEVINYRPGNPKSSYKPHMFRYIKRI